MQPPQKYLAISPNLPSLAYMWLRMRPGWTRIGWMSVILWTLTPCFLSSSLMWLFSARTVTVNKNVVSALDGGPCPLIDTRCRLLPSLICHIHISMLATGWEVLKWTALVLSLFPVLSGLISLQHLQCIFNKCPQCTRQSKTCRNGLQQVTSQVTNLKWCPASDWWGWALYTQKRRKVGPPTSGLVVVGQPGPPGSRAHGPRWWARATPEVGRTPQWAGLGPISREWG